MQLASPHVRQPRHPAALRRLPRIRRDQPDRRRSTDRLFPLAAQTTRLGPPLAETSQSPPCARKGAVQKTLAELQKGHPRRHG